MIRFKKVTFRNFLSTGNKDTVVQLDKNRNTLIIGKNGAGKTSVLEAISYALYGRPMRNVNKPQLTNTITGKGLMTEIEFDVGAKSYVVRRGIKPTVFEIIEDGKLLNQDSAAKDYQEVLEGQILKLNHKSFSQIVVLSIANFTPFMKLTAAGRREVIEDLLNIQIFSIMNVLLKEKVAANKTDFTNNTYEIRLIENKIEMHARHLAEINQNNEELVIQRETQIESYKNETHTFRLLIKEAENKISELADKMARKQNITTELTNTSTLHKAILDKRKKIEREIEFYLSNTSCPTCKQEISEAHKTGEVSKKNSTLVEAGNAIAKLEKTISRLQASIAEFDAIEGEIATLNKSLSEYNIREATAAQFIESLEREIVDLKARTKTDDTESASLTAELNTAMHKKETIIKDREIFLMASQLLKDGGIKTRIIRQYIPVMNKLINKYLAQMDFFVQFELDETFKESIKSRFRDEFSYESFSQGEKLRIDLSLLFCWRAIAKLRNSASTNLLFMDEILDSSLDTGGVDEFLKIINNLTNETNCFIISHRGDQMLDRFDHVIRFEKIKNFSKIAA